MEASMGELWVAVDDDNVLAPDYLVEAFNFMMAHPAVGALGGRILLELAASAPAWLLSPVHSWRLAQRDFGPGVLVSTSPIPPAPYPYFAPIGAGMVLRRAGIARYLQWRKDAPAQARLSDRTGQHLGTCGDSELVMQTALTAGQQVAYSPRLQILHLIPASRLRYRYLMRLAYQTAQTWAQFQCRYGLARPISRSRALARCLRAFFFVSAWRPSGLINLCEVCGYQLGLSRQ